MADPVMVTVPGVMGQMSLGAAQASGITNYTVVAAPAPAPAPVVAPAPIVPSSGAPEGSIAWYQGQGVPLTSGGSLTQAEVAAALESAPETSIVVPPVAPTTTEPVSPKLAELAAKSSELPEGSIAWYQAHGVPLTSGGALTQTEVATALNLVPEVSTEVPPEGSIAWYQGQGVPLTPGGSLTQEQVKEAAIAANPALADTEPTPSPKLAEPAEGTVAWYQAHGMQPESFIPSTAKEIVDSGGAGLPTEVLVAAQEAVDAGEGDSPQVAIKYIQQTTGMPPAVNPTQVLSDLGEVKAIKYLEAAGITDAPLIISKAKTELAAQELLQSTLDKSKYETFITNQEVDTLVNKLGAEKAQITLSNAGYGLETAKSLVKASVENKVIQDKQNNAVNILAGYLSGDAKQSFLDNGTLSISDIDSIVAKIGNSNKATVLFMDAGFTDSNIVPDAVKRNQYQDQYGKYIQEDGTVNLTGLLMQIEVESVGRGGILTGKYNQTEVTNRLVEVAQIFNFKDFDRSKAAELVAFSMATPEHKFEIMKANGEGGITKNDYYTGVDDNGNIQYVTLNDKDKIEAAFLSKGEADIGWNNTADAIKDAGLKLPQGQKGALGEKALTRDDIKVWYNTLPSSDKIAVLSVYQPYSVVSNLKNTGITLAGFIPVVSFVATGLTWNSMNNTERAINLSLDILFAAPFIRMGAKPFVKLAMAEGKATGAGMQEFLKAESLTTGKIGKLQGAASLGEPVISSIGNKVKTFSSLDRLAILQSSMDSFTAKALDKELWLAEDSLLSGNAVKIKTAGLRLQAFGSSMIKSKIPGGDQILKAGSAMASGATELARAVIITPSYVTGEAPYAEDIEKAVRALKTKSKEYWNEIKNSKLITEQKISIGFTVEDVSGRLSKLIDRMPSSRRDNLYKALQGTGKARREAEDEMWEYLQEVYGKDALENYIRTGEWEGKATISGPESSVLGTKKAIKISEEIEKESEKIALNKSAMAEVDKILKASSPEALLEKQAWDDAAKLAKELRLNTDKVYHLKSYAIGEGLSEGDTEALIREYKDSIAKGVHTQYYRAVGLRVKELREIARGATQDAERIAKERKGEPEPELEKQKQTEFQRRTKTITKEEIKPTSQEVKVEKSKTRTTREERAKAAEKEATEAEKKAAVREAEKLTEAEKARLKDKEYWRQKARENWTEKQREAAAVAAIRIATKTATATDTDLLADTLSRVLSRNLTQGLTKVLTKVQVATLVKTLTELLTETNTEIQAKAQAGVQTKTNTLTSTKTKNLTQAQTKTLTQAMTKILTKQLIKTEIQTKTQTKIQTKTQIQTKPLAKQKIKTKITVKTKLKIPVNIPVPRGSAAKKKLVQSGTAAWKQGLFYKIATIQNHKLVVLTTKEKPEGVPIVKGVKSAFKTLTRQGQYFPPEAKYDMGIMDVKITKKGKKIKFTRDIKRKTHGNYIKGEPELIVRS